MNKEELESKLIVGAKIKFGAKYCEHAGCKDEIGKIVELVEGYFDYDNGLYTATQTAPSIWYEEDKDFDSIYHLFGNNLEDFLDCEIITEN